MNRSIRTAAVLLAAAVFFGGCAGTPEGELTWAEMQTRSYYRRMEIARLGHALGQGSIEKQSPAAAAARKEIRSGLEDPDKLVRASAVKAAARGWKAESTGIITPLLSDNAAVVRLEVIHAMQEYPSEACVDTLAASLKKETDAALRVQIVRALGKTRSRHALAALVEALDDEDAVRFYAIEALSEITGLEFGRSRKRWKEWWEKTKAARDPHGDEQPVKPLKSE